MEKKTTLSKGYFEKIKFQNIEWLTKRPMEPKNITIQLYQQ